MNKYILLLIATLCVASARADKLMEIINDSSYDVIYSIKDFTSGLHADPAQGVVHPRSSQTIKLNYDALIHDEQWSYEIDFSTSTGDMFFWRSLITNKVRADWICNSIDDNPNWRIGCYWYPSQILTSVIVNPEVNFVTINDK